MVLGLEVLNQAEIVVVIAVNWSEINASDAGSGLQEERENVSLDDGVEGHNVVEGFAEILHENRIELLKTSNGEINGCLLIKSRVTRGIEASGLESLSRWIFCVDTSRESWGVIQSSEETLNRGDWGLGG